MRNRKGFTSIEIIIVLLCLSILTAMVIVKNPFTMGDYGLIASEQLAADIRVTQLKATGTKVPQNIRFNLNTSTYELREGTTVIETKKLPEVNRKETLIKTASFGVTSNVLTFNTLGEPSSGGTITVGDASGEYTRVTVYAITGRVLVQPI